MSYSTESSFQADFKFIRLILLTRDSIRSYASSGVSVLAGGMIAVNSSRNSFCMASASPSLGQCQNAIECAASLPFNLLNDSRCTSKFKKLARTVRSEFTWLGFLLQVFLLDRIVR